MGVDPERLRLEWISASEGGRFAQVMNDFIQELRNLGPLSLATESREERAVSG
jgi:coenzyme F420-reducing hydrogenase delta subunit